MNKYLGVLGRILLAQLFLSIVAIRIAAIMNDPDGYSNYQQLLAHFGLPGIFAPLIILIQLVGGLALLLGYKTSIAAFVLAGFSIFLAFVLGSSQPDVLLMYLAIAGGLIVLAVNPKTALSLDNLKNN